MARVYRAVPEAVNRIRFFARRDRGILALMRTITLLAVCGAAMPAPAADPVDTSFLKHYAETRGFMLGRPVKPKITPDGKTVLFLRSEATVPKQKLFAFDVETGTTTELLS